MIRASPPAPLFLPVAILIAAGCAEVPPPAPVGPAASPAETRYQQTPFTAVPGWQSAEFAPGVRAFAAGCPWIAAPHALRRACDAALAVPANDESAARRFVEATFAAWEVLPAEGAAEGTITGYYEPILQGSRVRTDHHRYPVYGVPEDLVPVDLDSVNPELKGLRLRGRIESGRLVPYWTRAQIEDRARADGEDRARADGDSNGTFRAPVLAWVGDPVELLFLQIQGSGWIDFAAGGRLHLGYADQNGHPYRSIGRFLVERRELTLDQASMQGIKAWAAANPRKLREALDFNPSYVFFRELPAPVTAPGAADGPIGALGAPLTAGYSLAVDPRSVPLGAPVFLATTMPLSSQPLQRLMAAQDTGGAIRGAARADFYWGTGNEAGALAGRMRQQGRMWVLWPRDAAAPKP